MKTVTGMEEVIAHERAIREGLQGKLSLADRVAATAMLGSAWRGTGTRLDALKEISKRLKLVVDV